MIHSEERDDVTPICPYCDQPVRSVQYRMLSGLLGKRYIYFCASCQRVLGITQRKGFWMG